MYYDDSYHYYSFIDICIVMILTIIIFLLFLKPQLDWSGHVWWFPRFDFRTMHNSQNGQAAADKQRSHRKLEV